ncbi:hypothetical protein ACT2FY_24255 [Paraburkholderia fungorum]|uniref:hypothetical protein n=1 Tax=Paraburkholderia fungorum TaxID=134537 RepID=UPI00402B355C
MNSLKYAYDALGALLEAAIRDQKSTADAVKSMKALTGAISQQSRDLPGTVSAGVKRELEQAIDAAAESLSGKVGAANIAADTAVAAFERATRRSMLYVCVPALLASALAMATWYGVTAWSVRSLQKEKTELQESVALLEKHGGRLDVTSCRFKDGHTEPCIRVDVTDEFVDDYRIPVWRK